MRKLIILAVIAAAVLAAGCGGGTAVHQAGPDPATVQACKDLRQFMSGSASDSLAQDPFRFKIFTAMRPGSRFAVDFNRWLDYQPSVSATAINKAMANANKVIRDCNAAGVRKAMP
jgi:hypothetical protein